MPVLCLLSLISPDSPEQLGMESPELLMQAEMFEMMQAAHGTMNRSE